MDLFFIGTTGPILFLTAVLVVLGLISEAGLLEVISREAAAPPPADAADRPSYARS